MVASPIQILQLVHSWETAGSDPLLSEHTRIRLRQGDGQIICPESGDGIATLVPSQREGIGLVELAKKSPEGKGLLWNEIEVELMTAARDRKFVALEILDRGSTMDIQGSVPIGAVRRMKLGPDTPVVSDDSSSFSPNDFDSVLELVREAFAGHPENGGWSAEDLKIRMVESWFDPEGLRMKKKGDDLVGICWTKVHPDGVGEIYLLAVGAKSAGLGFGRSLVSSGLWHLKKIRGCDAVILYTEASNEESQSLYESVGFTTDRVDGRIEIKL